MELKIYQIEIVETLSRVEEVEANSASEAKEIINNKYITGEIILTADNANSDYEINIL
jgi:uncharacterized membrane protein